MGECKLSEGLQGCVAVKCRRTPKIAVRAFAAFAYVNLGIPIKNVQGSFIKRVLRCGGGWKDFELALRMD